MLDGELGADPRLANCQWYFGHEVQVITFFKPLGWCVVVVPASSTMASAMLAHDNNAIHLFSHSYSIYKALGIMQDQLQRQIGKSFRMGEGNDCVIVDDSKVPCDCIPPVSSPMIAEQQSKLLDLDTRLQGVEKDLSVILEPIESSDIGSNNGDVIGSSSKLVPDLPSAAEIWPMLQRIERTLDTIEQRMERGTVEIAAGTSPANSGGIPAVPPTADDRSTEPDTTADSQHHQTANNRSTTPESTADSQHHATVRAPDWGLTPRLYDIPGAAEHDAETSRFEPADGPHSPIPTQHCDLDTYWNDTDNGTVMTPSVTATVRSVTPRTGPDEAAVLNRDLFSLAGLLGTGGI